MFEDVQFDVQLYSRQQIKKNDDIEMQSLLVKDSSLLAVEKIQLLDELNLQSHSVVTLTFASLYSCLYVMSIASTGTFIRAGLLIG
jgi:hypothetical protein